MRNHKNEDNIMSMHSFSNIYRNIFLFESELLSDMSVDNDTESSYIYQLQVFIRQLIKY